MKNTHNFLLTLDAIINIILGILILLFPLGMDRLLGVPLPGDYFYSTILGAVILGIGIALLIERYGSAKQIRGLGLGGAIIINFFGSGFLMILLLSSRFNLPLRGYIILWSIVLIVFITGVLELVSKSYRSPKHK
jgi:hypothetical protein